MNLLRRLASLPGLRVVLLHPVVRRALASLLSVRFLRVATLTTRPVAFVTNDLLLARNQQRTYRLSDGGTVRLVHRRDTEAFHELYRAGEYEPPPALETRLTDVRRIVDIGGNIGMFAHWAARRWQGSHVVSVEPAPENLEVFRAWLAESGADVELVEAAAADHDGDLSLARGSGAGSVFTTGGSGPAVRGVDVFSMLAGVDLVKLDIEGGEWPILADPRLRDLHEVTLVMEYHRVGAPSLPADAAARRLLQDAGFTVGHQRHNHWGHGTLWAWKD